MRIVAPIQKYVRCHVSHVTCHVSCVTCHMSHVTSHMSPTKTAPAKDPPSANSPTMHSRLVHQDKTLNMSKPSKKSRLGETLTLSTSVDNSTDIKETQIRHASSHGYPALSISLTLTTDCGGYIRQVCGSYIRQVCGGYIQQVSGSYIRQKILN